MTFKEFTQSKMFSRIIYSIGGLLIALIIFQAGIFIGYRSAVFTANWNNAHIGNVRDPRSIFAPFRRDADDMNPHGAVGEIITIKLPTIVVKGPSEDEEMVLIGTTTSIRNMRSAATSSDLRVGQQVVVIGTPDDQGKIHAAFIRVVPALIPPPNASSSTMNNVPFSAPSINN